MPTDARDLKRGDCLRPTTLKLLGNPLDFIYEDHLRERQICTMLDRIAADAVPDQDDLEHVREFLTRELPLHLADEEEDLFPLLRRACEPEDEIGKAIERLTSDHVQTVEGASRVIADLDALISSGGAPGKETQARFRRFAAQARRHLILENAIILPFARLRLTGRDTERLFLHMAQRRGLDLLLQQNTAR